MMRVVMVLFLAVLGLIWPDLAAAQTPTPTPAVSISTEATTGRVWKTGTDRLAYVGARADVTLLLPSGFALMGRADATATADGAAPDFSNPASFSLLELGIAGHKYLTPNLGVAAAYQIGVPMQDGKPVIEQDHPERAGVFGTLTLPIGHLKAGAGIDEAAGNGVKALFGARVWVKGGTSVGVEGTLIGPPLIRTYISVQIHEVKF